VRLGWSSVRAAARTLVQPNYSNTHQIYIYIYNLFMGLQYALEADFAYVMK